jgi:hypothetical protein
LLSTPVRLGFLGTKLMDELGYEKGFKMWLEEVHDLVTFYSGKYVGLRFGRTGIIRYSIWTDIADPVHSISPTAVSHLDEVA